MRSCSRCRCSGDVARQNRKVSAVSGRNAVPNSVGSGTMVRPSSRNRFCAGDHEGRVAAVTDPPDPVQRPFDELAEIRLLAPAIGAVVVDRHVDRVLAEMHDDAGRRRKPGIIEMTLQPGADERPAHLRAAVVDGAPGSRLPVPAQLVHRLVDGGHFEDIAAGVARSALPGQRRRFRQAGRAKTLAVADQELLLLQRAQRALDLEAGQSGRVNDPPSSSSRRPPPRERPATPSDPSSSTCSSALRSGHRAAPEPAEIGARVTASSRMYAGFTQTDC